MTDGEAIERLRALLAVPGTLRIISSEVRPELRGDALDPRSDFAPGVLAIDPDAPKRPGSFVCRDVARIEGPNAHGRYVAFTAPYDTAGKSGTRDWCEGAAVALLRRLLEATLAGV